ncbi:MAG: hypothetical protein OEZ34_05730 [Spirochaetia bacterium]|nr:hypothetical protein [Spirochaetia bacterium]
MIQAVTAAFGFIVYILILFFQPDFFWASLHIKSVLPVTFLFFAWILYFLFSKKIKIQNLPNFSPVKPHTTLLSIVISVLSVYGFYSVRMNRFLPPPFGNGDSLHLIEYIPVHSALFGYLASFDELLDLFIHSVFYRFANSFFLLDVESSYAVLSAVCGGIYIYFFIRFMRLSGRGNFYAIALILFTPAMQIYAGYVENYTIVTLFLSVIFLECALMLDKKLPISHQKLIFMAVLSAIAFLFHIVAGAALPALIYLIKKSSKNRNEFIKLSLETAFPALLFLLSVWGLFLYFLDYPVTPSESFLFNPPFLKPSVWFRPDHLKDILNTVILASPFSIFVFIYIFYNGRNNTIEDFSFTKKIKSYPTIENLIKKFAPEPVHRFLLLASLSFFGLMFIHNPMIGFPADWDLHTLFHIPLNLYLYYEVTQDRSPQLQFQRRSFLSAAFLINAFFSAAWIHHNASSDFLSEKYRISAKILSENTLASLADDEVFHEIKDIRSKRKYTEVTQFYLKTAHFLSEEKKNRVAANKNADLTEINAMIAELNASWHEYRIVILDQNQYNNSITRLWRSFSKINVRTAELEKNQILQNSSIF